MKVLTIHAHPNPMSFTDAIPEHFIMGLKGTGIENVDHIYFNSILSVSPGTRRKYLEIAYQKGKTL